ncbi:unnamed protein product [Brachionus calyciflorus]|uniref:Uncharacterized protein n=1 Tax=Brachionus calyciflorus TaxID=104777 RepID=A0A814I6T4_9BILA|nr:unnamed protein product [Brachionus calyciflorus]
MNVPMDFSQFLNLFQTQFETLATKINQRLDAMDKSMSFSGDDKFKSITKLITPPSLMHNRFPKPMFRDSQSFLDNYNKEVELFQVRLMNTTIDELKLRVNNCNKEIGILKELLSNVVDDIDKSISDLDSKCRDELKDNESKQNEVFMRVEPSPFSVVKNFNQKSSTGKYSINTQVQQNTNESNNSPNENQSVKNKTTDNYKKKRGLNQRRSHNKLQNKKQRSNTNNKKLKRHDNFRRPVNTNSTKRFNSSHIQQINNAANNNSIVKSNVQTIRNRQGYQPVQNTSFNRPSMYKTQNNQIKQFIPQRQ